MIQPVIEVKVQILKHIFLKAYSIDADCPIQMSALISLCQVDYANIAQTAPRYGNEISLPVQWVSNLWAFLAKI